MTSEMIFSIAVLGIAAIHLLFKLVHFLARFKPTHAQENCKTVRPNWYVFFDTSSLYGDTTPADTRPDNVNKDIVESGPAIKEYQKHEAFV